MSATSVWSYALFRECCTPDEFYDHPIYFPAEGAVYRRVVERQQEAVEAEKKKKPVAKPPPPVAPAEVDRRLTQFKKASAGASYVNAQQAAYLARTWDLSPSQADIRRLHEETKGVVTYEALQQWMRTCTHPEDTEDNLLRFFEAYDMPVRTGRLTRSQVKVILSNFGEALTSEETEAILSQLGLRDPVDYREFVRLLLRK